MIRYLGTAINPEELAMLHRVFEAICKETDKKSAAADADARLVISLFHAGFCDENQLLAQARYRNCLLYTSDAADE